MLARSQSLQCLSICMSIRLHGSFNADKSIVPVTQIIVSHAIKKIQELIKWQAHCYRIVSASDQEFEVLSLKTSNIYLVKLEFMTCMYFQWQSTGLSKLFPVTKLSICFTLYIVIVISQFMTQKFINNKWMVRSLCFER